MGPRLSALVDILDGLADTIRDTVTGADWDFEVEPRFIATPSSPPAIDIYPFDPFRTTDAAGFGDVSGEMAFTVRARVRTPDQDAAQDVLLALMDDEDDLCVAAALQSDQTLSGLVASVEVDGPSGFRLYSDDAQHSFLGVEWIVTVINATT